MKKAYPNFDENMPTQQVYNISNWMNSMKDIYIKLHLGASKNDAVEFVTQKWDPNEKREFLNWLKYYESGDHTKYKRAQQSYYVNDDINYFLPNPKNAPSPIRNMNEQISNIPQEAAQIAEQKQNELSKEDKRKLIEDHRRKILGRLNSAEKLLSSHHGQMFAGPDFERLLVAIYELKKQIQTVNKMSLSAQTIVDLIIRQAGILNGQGYCDASAFMVKFAQNTPGDFSMNLGDIPAGGSQPQGAGSLGNMPPDLTQPVPTTGNAIDKFIENLEGFGITTEEDEDSNEAKDDVEINDDVILDQEIVPENKDDLFVSAQAIQPNKPMPAAPLKMPKQKPAEPKDLEVMSPPGKNPGMTSEEVSRGPDISAVKNDFDALIDSAFSNLKIADIVNKLEAINNIFRNREISRQLAIADVMLDRLGLATYFPELSEATNKQLEANNYCLTRIENILSRLRGTMNNDKIDLDGNEEEQLSPEANGIKSSLEQEEAKEKQRKEVKKQVQNKTDLEKLNKPEGEVENVQEELAAQPTQIETPPPKQQLRPNV